MLTLFLLFSNNHCNVERNIIIIIIIIIYMLVHGATSIALSPNSVKKRKERKQSCRVESDRGSPCKKERKRCPWGPLRVTKKTRVGKKHSVVPGMYFRSFVKLGKRWSFTLQVSFFFLRPLWCNIACDNRTSIHDYHRFPTIALI